MCVKSVSKEKQGVCLTCHVVNDCLEARAGILRAQHGLKERQAVYLHLGAACQMS